ncbi:RHS repeat-associated core domain-containing protein [Streptomyces sp. DvalAA-14]|uniref:LamG-like jellyroll fold domain-containing protein n=1 Tax=unclassified Streptomyces TaxID=2593676 RepID=UPI00081BC132|nr:MULTISPECIES: LamG-like jellyroll fold domain-containing protein [unclassified Streptomyces]MYS21865.1 Teneurin-1 [Streptomyces sp. SID4948]SCE02586.1 RHS repeat-associated core domain-containing protein [Streptomyces sp. DvalAA-14]
MLAFVALAFMLATDQAAADGATLPSLSMPSLSSFTSWVKHPPHWKDIPRQHGGTAAGRSHRATAASTRARGGAGRKPGTSPHELAAYQPHAKSSEAGRSAVVGGFSAKTSKRDAAASDATTTVYDNADGTRTRRVSQTPVNYRDPQGKWQPIDTKVRHGSDGRLHETANSVGVDFAAKSSDAALASFRPDAQHTVSYGLQGAAKVAGTVAGSEVTYAGALPQTDLVVAPSNVGVKESVVLHSARAANSWTFPLALHGLTPVQVKDGSIELRDAAGKATARIPRAYAYDAKVDPRSGDPTTTYAVDYQLLHTAAGTALKVTLDPSWLHDAARVFPVTVDPSIVDGWTTTYAESGADGDHSFEQTVKVGSYDSGTHSANSFVNHWYSGWDGSGVTVTAASLHLFDTWASTCTAERFDVALVTSAWTPTGVTTYPGPSKGASIGNLTPSVPHACANTAADRSVGDWVEVPLTTASIQGWVNGTTPDYGLAVYAATTDTLHWKQFGSFSDPALGPYIEVTYTGTTPPQVYQQYPNDNADVYTTTPELTAWSGGANSQANTTTKYDFLVYDNTGAKIADSGMLATGDWTVPAGKLKWGQTYQWTVQSQDAGLLSEATWYALSVEVPQPLITSGLSQNSSDHGFDASIGNYTTDDTDASVSVVGPGLDVDRSYNSRDPRWTGAFGTGWSSVFDARATEQYNAAGAVVSNVVTYPDGSQVGFGKNGDGSYTPPSGRFATFKAITGGYSLTDKDATVYAFTQSLGSGAYGITSVTDADGHALTFTWSGGHITTMTSVTSSRALHLTWQTPTGASAAHISSIATDLVDPQVSTSAQTWTYGYTGDQLTSVCSPISSTQCTTYGYTPGSQYQNASLDLGPHAMWPMSEASGTTGKDAVLANQGADNLTYSNVTYGAAGPMAGSTATAIGFNGTSSYASLPFDMGNNTDSGALSLWFKTSAGPGVLYSYASQPVTAGDSPGAYTPAAYVGTDGKLKAEFWNSGGIAPISTTASVADGKWHHMVLSAAGNAQTLYLDGAKVGSLSGTIGIQPGLAFGKNQPYNTLGAGFLGGKWPDEPNSSTTDPTGKATYFNGQIADAAWYDRPLVAADVTALRGFGTHAASLLNTITRPSGKAYQSMVYDPATTTLNQLTDENGGVWKLGTPTVAGSSQTYRSAVLGGAPATYFRLGEAAGASAAVDETRGGNGTYNAVTLGAAGPFSDQKAATFNGTSSYVKVPDTVTGATSASAELWFKTTHGTAILLNSQSAAIGGTVSSTTPQLWIGSDNKLHGGFYTTAGSVQLGTTGTVTDGKWHHVLLSATPTAQTLYLDGAQAATKTGTVALANASRSTAYVGAGTTGAGWTGLTNGTVAYFNGSLAEVAMYRTALTAQDAASHFEAGLNSTGLLPVETVKVTSPAPYSAVTTYKYDLDNNEREISETDGLGYTTSFGYDTGGFEHSVVDPNGAMTVTGHDVRGNVVSSTTCQDQAANRCSTEYYTYYPDDTTAQLTTADPRNDVLLTERDGRSASATDPTYLTTHAYDVNGDETGVTTPPVAGFPNGRTESTVYSDGTSTYPAADSGNVPKGLPVRSTTPGGAVSSIAYLHTGDVAATTDPLGLVTSYTYDGLGQVLSKKVVSDTYPSGLTSSYAYDAAGQVYQETDPPITDRVTGASHQAVSTTVYDADGDVTSQTVADATGGDAPRTETQTYDQYDQVLTDSDANKAAGQPNGNTTTYTYDHSGNKMSEVTSSGTTTQYTYDDDGHLLTQGILYTGDPVNPQPAKLLVESSRAYDPAGRLASITDAMGNTTAYTYTDNGLTAKVTKTSADGTGSSVLTANTFDAAGNELSETTDNGATVTNYAVDAASRTTSTTVDPTGVNRTTTLSYTPDDLVATETDSDATGSRTTTANTYDAAGDQLTESISGDSSGHPSGWWKLNQTGGNTVTDSSGTGNTASVGSAVTWTGDAAKFSGAAGAANVITTNGPVLDTTASYSVSAWVDLTDASTFHTFVAQGGTNRASFYLQYNPTANAYRFHIASNDATTPTTFYDAQATTPAALNTWTHLVGVFDASSGAMRLYVNGTLAASATDPTPWTGTGPLSISGTWNAATGPTSDTMAGSESNVQVYPRALTAADITKLFGNTRTGGTVGSSTAQVTQWTYDKRGLPKTMTDADVQTTDYSYDEAGNLAVTTAPAVQVETNGGTPATQRPVTTSGFNTYGEAVEEVEPDGNKTTTVYDPNGNKVSETLPPYTPAGSSTPLTATSSWAYDSDGNQISETTPKNETTHTLFDQLGDVAQTTAADGTLTHATYDANGEQLSVTDANGAVSQATYDYLGRPLTSTTLERFPTARTLTTNNSYAPTTTNPYGAYLSSTTSPGGVKETYGYNRVGETTSVTDGANNTTRYSYDYQGDQTRTTEADNTYSTTEYDASGRPVSAEQYDATGTLLNGSSQVYDGVGNVLASTDANQHTTHFTYDAAGTVTQEVEPVDATHSITSSFGYDASGNQTRFTDGRNNSWYYTYTPWGQQETVRAPATADYSSAADSTTTNGYDADGQLVSSTQPGGVTTTMTYDAVGNLKTASGSGADAATAKRSFTYDGDGQVKTAATDEAGSLGARDHQAATAESFGYDDRGDLLSASGSAGSSSFTYNDDSSPLTRTDAAGTTSYGYDTAGRLSTLNDASSGTQLTYGYNTLEQVSSVKYGATGQTRTYTYDTAHRLKSDTLVQGASTLSGITYGYDNNGNLTSKNTVGVTGASNNVYTYDQSDRLASWNNGATTTNYSYDASGNRTQVGANVYTYDARDQITSDGVHSYAYSARGTMTTDTSTADGAVNYTTDAFGNQITAADHSYTLDAVGRNITDSDAADLTSRTFQYSGSDNTIASDGNYSYSYDPSGGLTGVNAGSSPGSGLLAVTDAHNDVVGTFASGATSLSGSATYDPLGNVTATAGVMGRLGYQSGWTEADTGKVGTDSRWYNPATGTFMNKDSVSLNPVPDSVEANPFAYVDDNPLDGTDPSGHWGFSSLVHKVSHAVKKTVHKAVSHAAAFVYHYTPPIVHKVVKAVKRKVTKAVKRVRDVYHATVRRVVRVYHYAARKVKRVYHAAVRKVTTAYHAVKRKVKRVIAKAKKVVHAAAKKAKAAVHTVAAATRTAYKATVSAAKTAATYTKNHAAAITSFVVSTAVFAGCEAATVGVGTIGCAAIAGAAGSLVDQGFACADQGGAACSAGAFAGAAVTGAVAGALGGALGSLGGKILGKLAPKALEAVGGLFGKGATEAAESGATDATEEAAEETEAAGARSESEGSSCKIGGPHSFTGNTRVLLAGGASKPIDQVKVGDTIANSVPGESGTENHKVTAVIVTTTDHDFVDLTVKTTTSTATAAKAPLKARASAAAKTIAKSAAKKAAYGLAASAAILATLGATHHATTDHTATTAAVVTPATAAAQAGHLTTTFHHPFYDQTQAAFVEAKDLHPGDTLQTPTSTAQITAVRLYHANTTTYDLTIGDLHTYYVEAGTTPVLVHNCDTAPPGHVYRGGQYKDLKDPLTGRNVPGTEINHMPSSQANSEVFDIPEGQGLAIQMDKADHLQTESWGSSHAGKLHRAQQMYLLRQGRLTEALGMDIDNVRNLFGTKYDGAIDELVAKIPDYIDAIRKAGVHPGGLS